MGHPRPRGCALWCWALQHGRFVSPPPPRSPHSKAEWRPAGPVSMLGVSNTMAHYNNKVCNFKRSHIRKKKTDFTNVCSLSVKGKSPSFTLLALLLRKSVLNSPFWNMSLCDVIKGSGISLILLPGIHSAFWEHLAATLLLSPSKHVPVQLF